MTTEEHRRTPALLGLAAIVAIGFALRAVNIDDQPLWGDEALTLMIAQWPLVALFTVPNDPTPGLYYALHKLLIGPHAGVVAARSISLVAGTATIIATYAWAKACRISALPAAAFTALSFALVDYSQEARAYSLLVLFVALSGWAFVHWIRKRRLSALLTFGACLLLALYTHFVAIFWIAPMVIASVVATRSDPVERRKLEWMICILAALAVPEVYRLIRYPMANFSWLEQAGPISALNAASYVFLPFGWFDNDHWRLGPQLSAIAGLLLFGFLLWIGLRHRQNLINWAKQNQAGAITLLVSISLPIAIWLSGYFGRPIYMPRTILIATPGYFILVSLVLSFESCLIRQAVLSIYALNLVLTGTVRPKEDWRSAVALIAANARPGDVILLCPGWKAFALRHAVNKEIKAPLLVDINGRKIQVERALGGDPNWVNNYFVALTRRHGLDRGQGAYANAVRTWTITSGCVD